MFERRLKVLLGVLIAVTAVVLLRAAHVQIVNAAYWQEQANKSLVTRLLVETVRGQILDYQGRPLAIDAPCIDVAVKYKAIIRDENWMKTKAAERLRDRLGDEYTKASKSRRAELVNGELVRLNADLDAMWNTLCAISGKRPDEIEDIKSSIRWRVSWQRRLVVWWKMFQAEKKKDAGNAYAKWLLTDGVDADDEDYRSVYVPEEDQAHVVLPAISTETHNYLKKHEDELPGLVLRLGQHRTYPYGESACHVVGNLRSVSKPDLERNKALKSKDPRKLLPNDLIGRNGIELLCDDALRGAPGEIRTLMGRPDGGTDPVKGRDVRITIDIELQKRIHEAFRHAQFWDTDTGEVEENEAFGGAVVIDVATGEVRAMVSYPTYDINDLDGNYRRLANDVIRMPLLNRATQMQIEPGSTVKPMVGLGAVTSGIWPLERPVECTGYLVIDGVPQKFHRCWVTSYLGRYPALVAHHQIPSDDPHKAKDGNPVGWLVLADAIQRSCNVYFETLGDHLGSDGLAYWFSQFGLGQKTGVLPPTEEVTGRLPGSFKGNDAQARRSEAWNSAIGQSPVLVTPMQMANVAATIARNGIWMRPKLVADDDVNASWRPRGSQIEDLHLRADALAAVKDGMIKVVNTPSGSAYHFIGTRIKGVFLAGKTGSAQAAPFRPPLRDANGVPLHDAKGRYIFDKEPLKPNSKKTPNPDAPWYRGEGNSVTHAWFIGFAPADRPVIAFAVAVQYGGSGGNAASAMVKAIVDGCVELGYLQRESR